MQYAQQYQGYNGYQNGNQYQQVIPYNQGNQVIHPSQAIQNVNNGQGGNQNQSSVQPQYQQQSYQQQNYYQDGYSQNMFQVQVQPQHPYHDNQYTPYQYDYNLKNNSQYNNNFIQDQYKGSEQQNIQYNQNYNSQVNEYDPSTLGIDQQLQVIKQKEEQNVKELNIKRKNPELKENKIETHKKDDKFEKNYESGEIDFIQYLLNDIQIYFPQKPISVFLREYCSKMKLAMDISCDENENGLGFYSKVLIDGKYYPKGQGKSKKDAKEEASIQALTKMCEKDSSVKNYFVVMIDKEKKVHQKFKNEKQKSSSSESKNQKNNSSNDDSQLQDYDPLQNYRDEVQHLANKILRVSVAYEIKGELNNWEALCTLGKTYQTIGTGLTKKDAKNLSAYKMIQLVEQSNEKTIKTVARKAIIKQKINETTQKLSEFEELKKKIQSDNTENNQALEDSRQQEQQQKEAKQNELALMNTYSSQIDENYVNSSLTQLNKKSQLNNLNLYLNKFKNNQNVPDEVYSQLKFKFDKLIENKQLFEIIGLVDFCIVGSYEFKLLRKCKKCIDVILNFNQKQSALEKESIPYETLKILKQIFSSQDITLEEKMFITVKDEEEKDLNMFIYFSDVQLGAFSNEIHHTIWLSDMKSKIIGNTDVSLLLKFLRHWRELYNIQVSSSIFDFIAYSITHKFTHIAPIRNLVNFFEFVANNGLQDVISENKRNFDVSQMHYEMIKSIKKEDYDHFVLQCSNIYNKSDYSFLKSI